MCLGAPEDLSDFAAGVDSVLGMDLATFPQDIVMSSDDAVDAALAGLDAGEDITILALPDHADWDAYDAARQRLAPQLSSRIPAARYRATTPSA